MKIKLKTIIAGILLFFALVFILGIHYGDRRRQDARDGQQDLLILANQKQIPYVAKFLKLVRELERASEGKLTAYEIVEISKIIIVQCEVHSDLGLTPSIVMAVIQRESAFNPDAISKQRAFGLMQLIRPTMQNHLQDLGYGRFTKSLALDPIVNTECGIKELIKLRQYWLEEGIDNWLIVATSYFWGIRNTWELLVEKKRAELPSLEYGKGILDLAREWQKRGLS